MCKNFEFNTDKICEDIHEIYRAMLKFLVKNYNSVGLSIHVVIVLMAIILNIYCNVVDEAIGDITAKKYLETSPTSD